MKYEEERLFISEKIKFAYKNFSNGAPKNVQQKSQFDLVTEVDKNIEGYLIDAILKKFPDDNILSEETRSNATVTGRTWIIDPIDGTCNFARGIQLFGVQLALCDKGMPVMSVIYLPVQNEEYYATIGDGAFLNGKRIYVNNVTKTQNAIVDLGDFSHRFPNLASLQLRFVDKIKEKIGKLRILGSACTDFCFLSSGRTDAYVIMTDNVWDLVPGGFLAKEAGGIVTNLYGEEYCFGDYGLIATATPALHKLIIECLND